MGERTVTGRRGLRWLKRKFVTGLIVLLPTVVTAYVIYRVFRWVDGFLRPVTARYPFLHIPGLGVAVVVVVILLAGVVGGGFFGRTIVRWVEGGFDRVPMVRSVFAALKQVSEAFLKQERTVFREVVLVRYPRPGIYVVGLVTSSWSFKGAGGRVGDFITVFLPTTPNPTSGIFLMVPRSEVLPVDLTIEDALKMVISGGTVLPPGHRHAAVAAGGPGA